MASPSASEPIERVEWHGCGLWGAGVRRASSVVARKGPQLPLVLTGKNHPFPSPVQDIVLARLQNLRS